MPVADLSQPGTLIHARGREWVVLPESTNELLLARPVGGLDEEITGIIPVIEPVESTAFQLPTKEDLGDFSSGKLLREAARLSTRAAAGPFRSFGRIAVEPRPYQLVPLMMALKLDPIRLLIADDVGIGKTVEAAAIARELLDRAEIHRLAVLCPPHLAEQWQRELAQKFHIDAVLVLSSTIQTLERDLPVGVSVFDRNRFTIVSTDFIKTTRRTDDFILKCPEFVIVDEAHGCTLTGGIGRGRQQRFELIKRIAADKSRHLVLVTATPHSGNEDAFRSLLSLLDEEFAGLPTDLDRAEREGIRKKLARHLVQRRRADIRQYLETDTPFPERKDKETTYSFSKEYRALFNDILTFAREYVAENGGVKRRRRVRYWSALALLRCVSSSPAAAVATLTSRTGVELESDDEIDDYGRRTILDVDNLDEALSIDLSPGTEDDKTEEKTRRRMLVFAKRAKDLTGDADQKLQGIVPEIKKLLSDGFRPIVFCRFLDTSDYVARELCKTLGPSVRVESVTGALPPTERETRIAALTADSGKYVLVCTDCLSEGINLQDHFNAVLHYDLAWNPTRHEQREGRVDRFGQEKSEVRVVTYYGKDNPIDGVILEVLIRKHKSIKNDLGVTVTLPGSSEQIAETLFEGALFREQTSDRSVQLSLDLFDDLDTKKTALHKEWDNARDREKASRSRFAQHALSPEAVAAELKSVRMAIGSNADVSSFFLNVLQAASVPVKTSIKDVAVLISNETPRALRQAIGYDDPFTGRFDLPLKEGDVYLGRTSPVIEGLAGWILDQALDRKARDSKTVACRCGVITTTAVTVRTTLLVARFRYHLQISDTDTEAILCEEICPLVCTGTADSPQWLTADEGESLLTARPDRNLVATAIEQQIELLLSTLPKLQQSLAPIATERAAAQLAAHERVREATRIKGRIKIKPVLPGDILGAYTLLPRLS